MEDCAVLEANQNQVPDDVRKELETIKTLGNVDFSSLPSVSVLDAKLGLLLPHSDKGGLPPTFCREEDFCHLDSLEDAGRYRLYSVDICLYTVFRYLSLYCVSCLVSLTFRPN